jgi:hypothetical protein
VAKRNEKERKEREICQIAAIVPPHDLPFLLIFSPPSLLVTGAQHPRQENRGKKKKKKRKSTSSSLAPRPSTIFAAF